MAIASPYCLEMHAAFCCTWTMKRLFPGFCVFSCLIAGHVFAGSATWSANPTSVHWNTASNWTPTYMIDDGTAESGLGVGNSVQNFEALWFNQFDVIPGLTTIAAVSVAWGSPIHPDPDINGTPVILAIWSDPNGDGDPHD